MATHDTLFSISLTQAEQTYPLRAAILLNGNLDACELHGDHAATTLHLAIRNPAGIIAVASLCEERRDDDPAHAAWRLRGMAVRSEVRGLGFGSCWCGLPSGTRKRTVRNWCGAPRANRLTGSMKSSASCPMGRR